VKVWQGKSLTNLHSEHLAKKVWWMNKFSQKVTNVSRNLDGFSLVNQG